MPAGNTDTPDEFDSVVLTRRRDALLDLEKFVVDIDAAAARPLCFGPFRPGALDISLPGLRELGHPRGVQDHVHRGREFFVSVPRAHYVIGIDEPRLPEVRDLLNGEVQQTVVEQGRRLVGRRVRRVLGPTREHSVRCGGLSLAQTPEPHPNVAVGGGLDALEGEEGRFVESRVRLGRDVEDNLVSEVDEFLRIQKDIAQVLLQSWQPPHVLSPACASGQPNPSDAITPKRLYTIPARTGPDRPTGSSPIESPERSNHAGSFGALKAHSGAGCDCREMGGHLRGDVNAALRACG